MSRASIGVAVHAEPERLRATLDSLRAHTPPDVELLLLPDGPDPATATALAALPAIRQIGTVEPLGSPACFNRLVSATNTEIVVLLESGAQVTPGWLDHLLAALDADPRNGLAGPSTNRSWNEQGIFRRAGDSAADLAQTAADATRRFRGLTRTLEPLYSLADFCYVVRRAVVEAIGGADEGYGLGPCWELDYNIRAARAGFRGVWACAAYVHRAPFTARRQQEETRRFAASKQRYQDRFCGLRLRGEKTTYEPHCRGDACPHFAPSDLIPLRLPLPAPADPAPVALSEASGSVPVAPRQAPQVAVDAAPAPPITVAGAPPDEPLVSCIMPTRNRRAWLPQALAYFARQDYPHRELIVVDDGDDKVDDLIPPGDPRIRYVPLAAPLSIGAKRNLACGHARGAIIAHWDDDDWYGPERLRRQVAPLLAGHADVTGLETACFFDAAHGQAWTCTPALHRRLFVGDVHGGTLVYWRWLWERLARYPAVSLAEDASFLRQATRLGARLEKLPTAGTFVYVRHDGNAWGFPLGTYLDPTGWQPVDPDRYIPPADRAFYAGRAAPTPAKAALPSPASSGEAGPLITCIMPTYNRRPFVLQAIAYFLRQEYPERELLILDDGTDPVADLVPADPRIRYVRLAERMVLGAKRNRACELARGTLIAHWDDDDWIAPWRLRYQVEVLESRQADLCGAGRQLYYDPVAGRAWLYEYPPAGRRWLAGNTLCYRKAFWARKPFPPIPVGEDTRFTWSLAATNAVVTPDHRYYVGLLHEGNTSRKIVTGAYWHAHPVADLHEILGSDLPFYRRLRPSLHAEAEVRTGT